MVFRERVYKNRTVDEEPPGLDCVVKTVNDRHNGTRRLY